MVNQSITSLPEDVCERILRANNWDLQISINRVFDDDPEQAQRSRNPPPEPSPSNESSHSSSTSELRRRNPQLFVENDSDISANNSNDSSNPNITVDGYANAQRTSFSHRNDDNNDNNQSLIISVWKNIPWIIRLPFSIFFSATQLIYDFLASIINPALCKS